MDWTRQVDIYCERVSMAFWAEPFNAATNVAFILAGLLAVLRQGRLGQAGMGRELAAAMLMACGIIAFFTQAIAIAWASVSGAITPALTVPVLAVSSLFIGAGLLAQPRFWDAPAPNWPLAWLGGNAMVVGVGSFLFHTFATPWAGAADSGPILLFILGFFVVSMNRFAGLVWRNAALATVGFLGAMIALSALLRPLDDILGGSQSYIPALLALLAIGYWLSQGRNPGAGRALMLAGGVFALSLTFRTLDGPLCDLIPIGTHFLWHLCNALVFWILLSALIAHGRAPIPRAATQPA